MSALVDCWVQHPNCMKLCFPQGGSTPEFFDIPTDVDFMNCAEFEAPACDVATNCPNCAGTPCEPIIKDLYKCIVNHHDGVDPLIKLLVDCPFTCLEENAGTDVTSFLSDLDLANITDVGIGDENTTRFLRFN
jgi:hypothetical protein